MIEKIHTVLILLGIISALAVVAERVKFPFPILLVIAGLLIALLPRLPEVRLNPEVVFLIFLPPLLFSAAWNFPWEDFRSNFLPILGLAIGLVFATIICVGIRCLLAYPGPRTRPGLRARRNCIASRCCRRDKRLKRFAYPEAFVGRAGG